MIRHEHVQHFGGANSVKQLKAKFSFPLFAKMSRQGFARRDTEAQARTVELRLASMMFEQKVVHDGNAEKNRGPVIDEDHGDNVWDWFRAGKNSCRAVQQRKREAVAETVSKR